MAVSTQNTDILTASLGRPIVLAYGRHLVGGNVILMDQSDLQYTTAFIALGEGQWDAVEDLWINGLQIDVTAPGLFQFHKGLRGELSSNGTLDPEGQGTLYPFDEDGDQKVDSLTPPGVQGLTFSRTSYLSLKFPLDVFSPTPGIEFQGVFRTRKVRIFDSLGNQIGFAYSDNPAWQIADLLTQVRGLPDSRLDWASFAAAATYCTQPISVNGESVPRFVSHLAFTQEVDFDKALEALLATCRGCLLDAEGTIRLRIDQPRSPVFDFTMDNIVEGSFSAQWMDTRSTPNRLEISFRDLDNDFVLMTKPWNHEPQQSRTGRIIVARIDLGNLPQHQAERIGNYLLTRAIDNSLYCKLRATAASLAVMPGDVVRVRHDAAPWGSATGVPLPDSLFETFEVIEAADNPDETRDFLLQLYRDNTYPDTAGPAQNLEGTTVRARVSAPPKPPNWNLSANLGGELRLSFAIPQGADYRTGDLTLLADEEPYRVLTTLAAPLSDSETTLQVSSSSGFLLGDYVNVGQEILKIAGPGVIGASPTDTAWQVVRAQKLTAAAAADAGAAVYRLSAIPVHFVLPPGFTLAHPTINLADSEQYHVIRFRPGRLRILHASLCFTGLGGISETIERGFALLGAFEPNVPGSLAGMRTSSGGLGTIQIPGPLATGDDLAMPLVLPNDTSIGVVYAAVAQSALGQPIRLQLKLDGADFGPAAELPVASEGTPSGSGVFVSGAQKGNVGGSALAVSILQTGSDTPGEDLTLYVTV
jgi:putative tail protein